jgi:hypothetical protein
MIIYVYTHYIIYIEREREENKIVLVDLSEGTSGDGRRKENVRE